MLFTPTARLGYANLFATMVISPDRLSAVDHICEKIVAGRERYSAVAERTRVPWALIGTLHQMESSCNFGTHLHNGDPLTARTKRVPRGRPAKGSPPFTWEESAIDALMSHNLHKIREWSMERMLYEAERYNGWGYVRKGINSPYIWSFTNKYSRGKYISDGKFSTTAVSKQCGVAPILKRLEEQGHHIMTELLTLLPLIEKVAPTVAGKLLGSEGALVVSAIAEALQLDSAADQKQVADALEGAPTSRATEALLRAEGALSPVKADDDPPKTPQSLSPNGLLVDPEASVAKTLIFGLLLVISTALFRNAAMSHTIAEALTPLVTGVVTMVGSGVMPWLLHRSVSNANANTLATLKD